MCAVTLASFIAYRVLSWKHWDNIIRYRFYKDKTIVKDILGFTNYNMLYSGAQIARDSGSNMLINFFFDTVINGAYAIARTVNSLIVNFMSNIDTAAGPQIVQNYSAGNSSRYTEIINRLNRYTILVTEAICLILFVELEWILRIWLKDVPSQTLELSRAMLLMSLIASTSAGFPQLINASGRIKWFRIIISILYFACLPIGYFLFKAGLPSYWIILTFVFADIVWRIIQLIMVHRMFDYDIAGYLKETYPRSLAVLALYSLFAILYSMVSPQGSLAKIAGIGITAIFSFVLVYYIGLHKAERTKILGTIRSRIPGLR